MNKEERRKKLVVGSKWKHFKGGEYIVLMLARIEATQEDAVVYRQAVPGMDAAQAVVNIENGVRTPVVNWVRSVDNFMGVVVVVAASSKHKLVQRFEPME